MVSPCSLLSSASVRHLHAGGMADFFEKGSALPSLNAGEPGKKEESKFTDLIYSHFN